MERQQQLEFKVIVRADADTWPHEIKDEIWVLLDEHGYNAEEVVSVEQILDEW